MKVNRTLTLLLVAQVAFVAAVSAAPLETIIYQDGFTVDGVERQYGGVLNGSTIEGSMIDWVAPGGLVFAHMGGEDVVYANGRSNSALINADLTPVGGTIKVEADVMPLGTAPGDTVRNNWVAIGFQPGQTSTGHGGAGLWMLLRGNGGYQAFLNGTSTGLANDSIAGYVQGQVANVSITYDSATNIATFSVDEQVILTHDLTGTSFPEAQKRPFIITYDGGQYFDNYTVSMEGGVLPIITSLQSPRNDAIQVNVAPELSWSVLFPAKEDLAFDVYMDPNETKVANLDPSALVTQHHVGFSYVLETDLQHETTYYWRVVPYIDGEPNDPTELRHFTTDYEVSHWSDASWTDDADSGISAGKIYTHAVNLNGAAFGPVLANGVLFEAPAGKSGANWQLEAFRIAGGGAINIAGTAASLVSGFYYDTVDPVANPGLPATLSLTGLTPGQEYTLTLYTKGWGAAGERNVRIVTSDDGRTVQYDENVGGDGNGHTFRHTYTTPESGELTADFFPVNLGNTWHHYAFTNEIVPDIYVDPTPVPGSQIVSNVDLSWQLYGDVTNPSYNLYVATDPNMQDRVVAQTGMTSATYFAILNPEVNYYWRVEVVEDGGPVVHTSPVWTFLTSPPPDAEKVLEWSMDQTAGPIAYQTGSSEDADGALMGFNDPNASSMFVTGLVGNALLLNGTSQYVDVSDAFPYMPTANEQAFAISAYFRTFYPYGPIFSMRHSVNDVPLIDIAIGADGAYEAAGKLRMLVRDDGGVLSPARDSGILVNDGRWHSLVVMRALGNWTMYVDGIERAKLTGVASGLVSLDWLAIGTEKRWVLPNWTPDRTHLRYFKGMLDEVCVWSGEMRPHQIQEHAALVPPAGDLDFDLNTNVDDLKIVSETWLADSYTPVQSSPRVLEDMDSYNAADPNTYIPYWQALEGAANVGASVASIQSDPEYGQVLQWAYDFEARNDVMARFWLRDRRCDLGLYDQVSVRVKKLPGSTGEVFYFDLYDGRGLIQPAFEDLHWKGRISLSLADLPEDQWQTLVVDIPGGFDTATRPGSRPKELNDLYEVTLGISRGSTGTTGTILIDEIALSDSTTDCFPQIGELLPDMNGDCLVNISDFAIMAQNWLMGL